MKFKTVLAATVIASFAVPAMADEYYVVREPHSKRCTVVTEKPKEEVTIAQIGPLAFKTRQEAEHRIKTTKICTEDRD